MYPVSNLAITSKRFELAGRLRCPCTRLSETQLPWKFQPNRRPKILCSKKIVFRKKRVEKNVYVRGGDSQPQSTCQPHFAEKWLKVDSGKKGSKGWLVARNFRLVSSHGPKKSTFLGLNRAKGWLLPQKSGWSVYMALKSQPFWGSTGLKVDSRRKNQGGQFTWPQKVNLFEAQQG